MANNVLPEELMLCILTRLPVKTIVRFKSVCKPWFHLFSTPEFKKLHQHQFSSDPENQSFIVDSDYPKHQFSIINMESGEKMPTILDHPFAHAQNIDLDFVGCCNGLVCLRSHQEIVLWNPAMNLSKIVSLKDCGNLKKVALGFGYDAMGDDFKVVRVLASPTTITSVDIYSANLGSWITIDVGFQFSRIRAKKELIVNGNPYWDAWVDGIQILVCFDVLELVFKIVPMPTIHMIFGEEAGAELDLVDFDNLDEETETKTEVDLDEETETKIWTETDREVELVDWNGALATRIINYEVKFCVDPATAGEFTECSARIESVRVLVFDDIERIWRIDHTFGPIKVDMRIIHCSKNEKLVGTLLSGTLFLSDLETGCVKELFDGACFGHSFEIYGYTESLAYINGMEKVVVKYEPNDLDD